MRDLALLIFLTLDGVMQSPGRPDEDSSGGFLHGGWARGCWDEVMEQVAAEAMRDPYDLLLGRATYDAFAGSFASEADRLASRLTAATKYVVTSDPGSLAWSHSVGIVGDVATEVLRLKEQEGPLLQVHGSWQLSQTLLSEGLVDELRLWTFPVVVGAGKRLFGDRTPPAEWTLLKADTTPKGATMGLYRRT